MNESRENLHLLDYWRVIRSRKEVVIAVSLLVVVVGVLVTYSMPKVYMASTIIQVKDKEESVDLDPWRAQGSKYNPLFLSTQFEVIQSRPIVEDVTRRLDLHRRLGSAYGYLTVLGEEKSFERTVGILSKNMKVQQYRNTDLIEIQMYLRQLGGEREAAPDEVARIVNMIANVYRDASIARSRSVKETALKALRESLNDQNERVLEAERKVEDVRSRYKLDMLYHRAGRGDSLTKESLRQLDALRIRARMELADKESRFRMVSKLSGEELIEAGPRIVGDEALSMLVAKKRQSEVDLKKLKEVYGDKHPNVLGLAASIQALATKIQDALRGLKTGVEADYEAAKAKLAGLEAELDKKREDERKAEGEGYREFEKAAEELDRAQRMRNALEGRYVQEKIKLRIPKTVVEIISPAKVPDVEDYVSPDFNLNIMLSILVGLAAGIGLAYFVEYLDTSVKTIEDIERHLGIKVVAVIPQKVKPLNEKGADPAHAEAYRILRTNIKFSEKLKGGKSLCFTSGSIGEGKSLSLFNLAQVCAQLGDRTLIADTDLHRPRQHRMLGMSNEVGVANVLVGDISLSEAILPTGIENLDILTSGRVDSGVHGLLDARRLAEMVRHLSLKYDYVLFDTPPIIGVSDASLVVREVDGVLLVIQHRKYPRVVSVRARDLIENMGGNLLGVVMNNINISRDYSYYYYQNHYYYHGEREKGSKRVA